MRNREPIGPVRSALLERDRDPRTPRSIRVASVPADHVYVHHLAPADELPGVPVIERLADPDPDDPVRPAQSKWWPPVMLEPEWVREHPEFDVMHLQFGFDARTPEQLQEWIDALRETGRPLVYTVHDLRNPHHLDRRLHDAQLDVIVPQADALVTLTRGAAAEIRERWGREAHVLPHPHVVDFATMADLAERSRPSRTFRVGVHVKSLRASMDPLPVIRVLCDLAERMPDWVVQVNGHRDVLEPRGERYDAELADFLQTEAARGALDLRIHDFLSDAELWEYLASLDVSVLPYRFGTHSGWLEACRDLGTAVVAPNCGYFSDQGPVFAYERVEDAFDTASLERALQRAHDAGRREPLSICARRTEREGVAAAHALLYERLLR